MSIQGPVTYPPSVVEFMQLWPGRYAPCEEPVEGPLSPAILKSGRHLVSARNTNKKLKADNLSMTSTMLKPMTDPSIPCMYDQWFQAGVNQGMSMCKSVDNRRLSGKPPPMQAILDDPYRAKVHQRGDDNRECGGDDHRECGGDDHRDYEGDDDHTDAELEKCGRAWRRHTRPSTQRQRLGRR